MKRTSKWRWSWRALLTAIASLLLSELANTAYRVYWDFSPEYAGHVNMSDKCDVEGKVLFRYCETAREALKHGFWHPVLTTTLEQGRWCFGQRCAELTRDVWTSTKIMAALASTGASAGLWMYPQLIPMLLDLWRTRHHRKLVKFQAREDRRCLPDVD